MKLEEIDQHIKALQTQMYYIGGKPSPAYEFHRILIRMEYLVKLRTMISLENLDID